MDAVEYLTSLLSLLYLLALLIDSIHRLSRTFCGLFNGSLSSAKRSPGFKVVGNIACFVLGLQLEVVLLTLFSLSLDEQVLVVVPANRLAFFAIEALGLFFDKFIETILRGFNSGLVLLRVYDSEHLVIVLVYVQLHWVLIVCE